MALPTLRQLEYVVALADTGLFVEAARQCAVSQPALSKQIQEVEALLGVALFERARPRALPTRAGAIVIARARRVLAEARELVEAAGAVGGLRRGTVRLGVIPTIAPYALPGLLVQLRRRFPDVAFVIQELQTHVLVEELRGGSIDVALLARPFDAAGLVGPDLVVEPFVLVAPAGHPLAVDAPVDGEEIAGASLILMADGHCLRGQAIEVCAAAGAPPSTSVTAASVATLVQMVESGLGATLLPASALAAEVRPGRGMLARSFRAGPPGRTVTLQWRASSPDAAFLAELGRALRSHYLAMNATMPQVSGTAPVIEPAASG